MNSISVKINNSSILNKLKKVAFSKGKEAAYIKAYKLFLSSKKKMLNEFDNHPVTLELKGGMEDPEGFPNISGTLGGYGNLYSFIGFNEGEDPIEPLRELLDGDTTLKYSTFRNNTWYFKVEFPSKQQLESVTDMPWTNGESWVESIEDGGISNLSHFLSKSAGRSTGGIQVPEDVNDDLFFTTRKYLTEIFEDFADNLER